MKSKTMLTILGAASLFAASCRDQPKPSTTETTGVTPTTRAVSTTPEAEVRGLAATKPAPGKPDPQMQAVLDELKALDGKPIPTLTASEARKQPTPADAVKKLLEKQGKPTTPEPVAKVEDRTVPGAVGPLPVRVYWPKGEGPFPVVVYFHGGGFVIASKDVYDSSARALTNAASAIVVSVDYRSAPEHKFPASHDDAFAAYQWVVTNAATLKGDGRKIAVAGESAGANLAANVSIMARDKKVRLPVHQLLVYPVAGSDMDTPSYKENADAKPLDKPTMKWFVDQTLKSPAQGKDPRIDLVHANLQGLPPTTIILAEIDPLRSEGEMLAAKMRDVGVPVEHTLYPGVTHEFFGMGAVVDKAKDAVKNGAAGLQRGFATVK